MKVFISWSGDHSNVLAEFLREWLKTVVAGKVEAFVSSQDIAKGERGLSVIASSLEDINYGIVLLTKESLESAWVNFEAGALSKSLTEGHVATVLVDLTRADVTGPLQQFQNTLITDKDDVFKLVKGLAKIAEPEFPEDSLRVLFDVKWPELVEAVTKAAGAAKPRTTRPRADILDEILYTVRRLDRDVRNVNAPPLVTGDAREVANQLFERERVASDRVERFGRRLADAEAEIAAAVDVTPELVNKRVELTRMLSMAQTDLEVAHELAVTAAKSIHPSRLLSGRAVPGTKATASRVGKPAR